MLQTPTPALPNAALARSPHSLSGHLLSALRRFLAVRDSDDHPQHLPNPFLDSVRSMHPFPWPVDVKASMAAFQEVRSRPLYLLVLQEAAGIGAFASGIPESCLS
ncbi:unnamed protein product [Cyclocybe aegerita]|uniref:Uncharacterized protein n=1 Tax=Cyclocybe aegerita TaxID=1973307 RepID=A0A8S0X4K2_CYCAE|nr:unnamed protein product [Cyclocybe aegerita]